MCVLTHCVLLSEVLQSWRVQFDSPISIVLLFPLSCQTEPNQPGGEKSTLLLRCCTLFFCVFSKQYYGLVKFKNYIWLFCFSGVEMKGYNLLVTSTIEMAVVYRSASECCVYHLVVCAFSLSVVKKMSVG